MVFGMERSGYIRCLNGWQPGDGEVWLREKSLLPEWIDAVTSNPLTYLSYRADVFVEFLRFGAPPYYLLPPTYQGEEMNLGFTENVIWWSFESYVKLAAAWFPIFFIPGTWFIIGVALTLSLTFKILQRKKRGLKTGLLGPRIALSSSALFYISGYFLAVTGADFRFIYWSVMALSFLIAIELISKAPTTSARDPKNLDF